MCIDGDMCDDGRPANGRGYDPCCHWCHASFRDCISVRGAVAVVLTGFLLGSVVVAGLGCANQTSSAYDPEPTVCNPTANGKVVWGIIATIFCFVFSITTSFSFAIQTGYTRFGFYFHSVMARLVILVYAVNGVVAGDNSTNARVYMFMLVISHVTAILQLWYIVHRTDYSLDVWQPFTAHSFFQTLPRERVVWVRPVERLFAPWRGGVFDGLLISLCAGIAGCHDAAGSDDHAVCSPADSWRLRVSVATAVMSYVASILWCTAVVPAFYRGGNASQRQRFGCSKDEQDCTWNAFQRGWIPFQVLSLTTLLLGGLICVGTDLPLNSAVFTKMALVIAHVQGMFLTAMLWPSPCPKPVADAGVPAPSQVPPVGANPLVAESASSAKPPVTVHVPERQLSVIREKPAVQTTMVVVTL
jgi:hypothetical protein